MMRVLVIGNMLHTPAVVCAAAEEGVELCCISSAQAARLTDEMPQEEFQIILAGSDHGGHASLAGNPLLKRDAILVPMCGENLVAGVGNVSARDAEQMGAYFAYGGNMNLRCGFRLLRRLAGENVVRSRILLRCRWTASIRRRGIFMLRRRSSSRRKEKSIPATLVSLTTVLDGSVGIPL